MSRLPAVLLAILLFSPTIGCWKQNTGNRYGPSIAGKGATLGDERKEQAADAAATAQRAPGRSAKTASTLFRWAGTVDTATAEAQQMEDKQKVLVLLTDGTCRDCLRLEESYLPSPAVMAEAERRWLFVRGDVVNDPGLLARYKVAKADLPVLIIVSEAGNENGRIETVPSTPEVLARIMHDRF
ncbi:MAG TPA: hypothetical protein VEI97_20980 [bacterium]|nr:hypothetical protein [bacterium]